MQSRRTREQWAALIGAFERSSRSVDAFCAARGIAPKTFRWWRWQLGETRSSRRRSESLQIVPVSVRRESVSECAPDVIMVRVENIALQIGVGTDVAYVTALVTSLRARC